jgi:hypothetical protein
MLRRLERYLLRQMDDAAIPDPGKSEAGVRASDVDGNDLGHAISFVARIAEPRFPVGSR